MSGEKFGFGFTEPVGGGGQGQEVVLVARGGLGAFGGESGVAKAVAYGAQEPVGVVVFLPGLPESGLGVRPGAAQVVQSCSCGVDTVGPAGLRLIETTDHGQPECIVGHERGRLGG